MNTWGSEAPLEEGMVWLSVAQLQAATCHVDGCLMCEMMITPTRMFEV